ncbi:hypothetical protein Fcan01_10569 [Folsomia candida]|uniref:Uncharacterized protein n=1 Tax=Folsomia candida TaxID=158441 RepID=A0A226EAM5_FOLCA|nr:hypothetical protein Fcan01_10569 [Folsomia candida]
MRVETPVSSPSELKEAVTKALEAKATDVCDLKEKLRESELARKSSENEAAKLKLRADQLSDDYATLAQEKKDLQDELDKKNALLGREQGRRANLEKKLEDAQTESLEKLGQLEDLKDALNGEKELRHKNEDKLDEQIFMYKTTLEVRDNELMNEIAKAKNIAEEAKKKDEEHIKFRHGMTERHRMNENFLKNLVNKGLDKVKDLELKLASAEAQCDILKPEMDKLKGENDRLNKDLDAARKEANKAEKEKDKFEKLYTDENAECRTLQDDLIKLKLTDKLDLIDLDHAAFHQWSWPPTRTHKRSKQQ